jgi:hypothetical protein
MPVVFSFRNQSNNRKLHIHFLVKQLAVISSYSGNYKRPAIRRPISRSNQHRFVSQLANALSNHPIVQPIPGISVALKIGYRTESSMRLIASKARNRNGFDSLPDSLKIATRRRFWICTIITTISALVSAGFSVVGLLAPSSGDSFARYAASRSIALLIAIPFCLGFRSRRGLLLWRSS